MPGSLPAPTHWLPGLCYRIKGTQRGTCYSEEVAPISAFQGPAKEIMGLSFSKNRASGLALLIPTKTNRPLINSPNLMAARTPASPPALMSLIDWT